MAPALPSNEIPSRIEAGPLAAALFFRGGGMRCSGGGMSVFVCGV